MTKLSVAPVKEQNQKEKTANVFLFFMPDGSGIMSNVKEGRKTAEVVYPDIKIAVSELVDMHINGYISMPQIQYNSEYTPYFICQPILPY